MDEVQHLLMDVKNRIKDQDNLIILVNCCSIRGKLIEVFGANITIKLDLFHAVQRVTKKMPKRHPFYYMCMNDLRLIFR
jgi:hypothetical protein